MGAFRNKILNPGMCTSISPNLNEKIYTNLVEKAIIFRSSDQQGHLFIFKYYDMPKWNFVMANIIFPFMRSSEMNLCSNKKEETSPTITKDSTVNVHVDAKTPIMLRTAKVWIYDSHNSWRFVNAPLIFDSRCQKRSSNQNKKRPRFTHHCTEASCCEWF